MENKCEVSDEEIRWILEALRVAYSKLDAPHFCEVLGLNPKWDYEYHQDFGEGVRGLFQLSTSNLIKLIRWVEVQR